MCNRLKPDTPTCRRALEARASSVSVSPVQYVSLPGASRTRSFQNGVEEYVGIEEILSSSIPSPCLGNQPHTPFNLNYPAGADQVEDCPAAKCPLRPAANDRFQASAPRALQPAVSSHLGA